MHRFRSAARWFALIVGTAFLTFLLFSYLIALLYAIAQAKSALMVP